MSLEHLNKVVLTTFFPPIIGGTTLILSRLKLTALAYTITDLRHIGGNATDDALAEGTRSGIYLFFHRVLTTSKWT
jgi:hypothetical protein